MDYVCMCVTHTQKRTHAHTYMALYMALFSLFLSSASLSTHTHTHTYIYLLQFVPDVLHSNERGMQHIRLVESVVAQVVDHDFVGREVHEPLGCPVYVYMYM
jgi:hypothetical protein